MVDEQIRSYSYQPPGPRTIVGGKDALDRLPDLVDTLGVMRAVIVTSPSVARNRILGRVRDLLGDHHVGTFVDVKPHSPIEVVKEALKAVDAVEADSVISLGGGSSIDTAKGVVWFRYPVDSDIQLTHIAIPSTLSGGEYTTDSGITLPEGKRVHHHPRLIPRAVVLDPSVVATVPIDFLGASLLNSIAHCLEGLVSIGASPMTDATFSHAIRLLESAHTRLDTDFGRYLAQGGAALAAINQAPMGLAHALVHIVGGKFKTPHAATHAIIGPAVMRFNLPFVAERQRMIADAFGVNTKGLSSEAAAWEAVKAARGIALALGVPPSLSALGVPEDRLVEVAQEVVNDPYFATNPKQVEPVEESLVPLRWAWSGEIPEP